MVDIEQRSSRLIEGIGNEVLLLITGLAIICGTVIFFITKRQTQNLVIHPDSIDNVQSTRQQLNHEGGQPRGFARRASQRNNGELQCPICLGDAVFAVETNCGHVYCGHCMITYWQHQTWLGAVKCPSCRTQVSLLLLNFTSEEHAIDSDEKRDVIEKVNNYNRRFSGEPRTLQEYIQDLPTLLRHAFHEFFSMGGLMWMFRLRIVLLAFGALVYLISPLDILPEAIFGVLGFMDDIFIFLLLAVYISIFYRQMVAARGTPA